MAITRLSGGNTPPDGSDPRTFPAIWNDAVDDIEALELPITADRIADGAVTAPKLAKTAGAVMVFDDATARTTAIPTPVEGMVTYLKDANQVQAFTGSAFTPVGGIVQVVSATKTDKFTTASGAFTDITDITVSITPASASSKVVLFFYGQVGNVNQNDSAHLRFMRDSTPIFVGDSAGSRVQATTGVYLGNVSNASVINFNASASVVDSPATTSAVTYKVQMRSALGNVATLGSGGQDADAVQRARYPSSIIAMEVAG